MAASGSGDPAPDSIDRRTDAQCVLHAYVEWMSRTRQEAAAFDAAVAVFRDRNPDLSEKEARRGVAVILCGKP